MNPVLPSVMLVEGVTPRCNFLRASLRDGVLRNEEGEVLSGLHAIDAQAPDAIILDIGRPDQESWEYAQDLRQWFPGPIIIITTLSPEHAGGLGPAGRMSSAKSLEAAEYQARMRMAIRHLTNPEAKPSIFQIDELRVDLAMRLVTLQGREVQLTPSEFRLLSLMIQHAGKVLTHRFLLEAVWGAERVTDIQSLRVYMSSLRRKIEVNPAEPQHLLTIQGIGYRLKSP